MVKAKENLIVLGPGAGCPLPISVCRGVWGGAANRVGGVCVGEGCCFLPPPIQMSGSLQTNLESADLSH